MNSLSPCTFCRLLLRLGPLSICILFLPRPNLSLARHQIPGHLNQNSDLDSGDSSDKERGALLYLNLSSRSATCLLATQVARAGDAQPGLLTVFSCPRKSLVDNEHVPHCGPLFLA